MITIVIPISRKDYLDRLFESLDALVIEGHEVNLLTYCDGDYSVFEKARNLTMLSKFRDRLCVERRKGTPGSSNFKLRRQRIADIHNEIKGLINSTDYIFLIEDDTLVPANALIRLMKHYKDYPDAGVISGIQVGRWGFKMLGAWRVNQLQNPTKIYSIRKNTGIQDIDAAGFYCCLMKVGSYTSHDFKPYQDILGPDFDFGLSLRQRGKRNYVDHDIECIHMTKKGDITFDNVDQVEFSYTPESDKMRLRRI